MGYIYFEYNNIKIELINKKLQLKETLQINMATLFYNINWTIDNSQVSNIPNQNISWNQTGIKLELLTLIPSL